MVMVLNEKWLRVAKNNVCLCSLSFLISFKKEYPAHFLGEVEQCIYLLFKATCRAFIYLPRGLALYTFKTVHLLSHLPFTVALVILIGLCPNSSCSAKGAYACARQPIPYNNPTSVVLSIQLMLNYWTFTKKLTRVFIISLEVSPNLVFYISDAARQWRWFEGASESVVEVNFLAWIAK